MRTRPARAQLQGAVLLMALLLIGFAAVTNTPIIMIAVVLSAVAAALRAVDA